MSYDIQSGNYFNPLHNNRASKKKQTIMRNGSLKLVKYLLVWHPLLYQIYPNPE